MNGSQLRSLPLRRRGAAGQGERTSDRSERLHCAKPNGARVSSDGSESPCWHPRWVCGHAHTHTQTSSRDLDWERIGPPSRLGVLGTLPVSGNLEKELTKIRSLCHSGPAGGVQPIVGWPFWAGPFSARVHGTEHSAEMPPSKKRGALPREISPQSKSATIPWLQQGQRLLVRTEGAVTMINAKKDVGVCSLGVAAVYSLLRYVCKCKKGKYQYLYLQDGRSWVNIVQCSCRVQSSPTLCCRRWFLFLPMRTAGT